MGNIPSRGTFCAGRVLGGQLKVGDQVEAFYQVIQITIRKLIFSLHTFFLVNALASTWLQIRRLTFSMAGSDVLYTSLLKLIKMLKKN